MYVQLPDPDEFEPYIKRHTCSFHELNPCEPFPGCTCTTIISQKRRRREEVEKIKADRRRKEEDELLARAELILAMRKISEK